MPRWPLSWSRNSQDVCRNGQMPRSRVSSVVFGWCVLIRLLAQNWLEIQSHNPVPEVVSFHDLIQSEVEKSILPESRDQSKVVRGYQQWRIGDKLCGQRMLPSMSAVKGCCSHQPLRPRSDGPPLPLPGDSGWRKRGYWPYTVKVHIKGMISVSPDLHLPIVRKVLTSLIWSIWFSLTVIFWCSNYLEIFLQKLLYILASPLTLLNIPSELSESVLSGLKSSVCSLRI